MGQEFIDRLERRGRVVVRRHTRRFFGVVVVGVALRA